MACSQIIIKPILSHDDRRLTRQSNWAAVRVANTVKTLCPMPIDWLWMELTSYLNVEWPDYIDQIAEAYKGAPPHTKDWE